MLSLAPTGQKNTQAVGAGEKKKLPQNLNPAKRSTLKRCHAPPPSSGDRTYPICEDTHTRTGTVRLI